MKTLRLKILAYFLFASVYYLSLVWMIAGSVSAGGWLVCVLLVMGSLGSAYGILWGVKYGIKKFFPSLTKRKETLLISGVFFLLVAGVWFPMATTVLQCMHFKIANPSTNTIVEPFFSFTTTTQDGYKISGIFLDHDTGSTIIMAHGLGANRNNFHLHARTLYHLGYNVASFDFRAHGNSDGIITSFGAKEARDFIAVETYLLKEHPEKSRILLGVGYSMGGVAMILAQAQNPVLDRLVIDSSYALSEDMIDHAYRFFPGWYRDYLKILGNRLTSLIIGIPILDLKPLEALSQIDKPILLIHCQDDTMIPVKESQKLHQVSPGSRLEIFKNCGHVGAMLEDGTRYEKLLLDFLSK